MKPRDLRLLVPIIIAYILLKALFTGIIWCDSNRPGPTWRPVKVPISRDDQPFQFWFFIFVGWIAVAFMVWLFWPRR